MKIAAAAAMREADRIAIEERGIGGLLLMTRAARAAFDVMRAHSGEMHEKTVVLFCGAGNNGGDGFCLGRMLLGAGASVRAFLVGDPGRFGADTRTALEQFEREGGRVRVCTDSVPEDSLADAHAAVDAMFGIGFHGALRGAALSAARLMNAASVPIFALDLPSGVETDTAEACPDAVRADVTVTFSLPKPACVLLPGALHCGRLHIADIGIPPDILDTLPGGLEMTTQAMVDTWMPARPADAHKGDFGRVLVIGGSLSYTGAVYLAAQAAVRSGAGLVSAAVPAPLHAILAARLTEAMPVAVPADSDGRMCADALQSLLPLLARADACLIGPGLSRSPSLEALVPDLLCAASCRVVLDADGINAVCGHIDILRSLKQPAILTPHDGEFARLTGALPPTGGAARLETARRFASAHRVYLVLKGHRTLTACPDGQVYVNTTGNPGMAKGGSGDVLAGLLASFLGQGLEPARAAAAAVYLHGAAGDDAANAIGEYGMRASDLLDAIPHRLRKYNSREW